MIVDLTKPLKSSFLSVERDFQLIIEKLFADHPQHAKMLKRLLVINEPDCLDNLDSEVYKQAEQISVSDLIKRGYIRFNPRRYTLMLYVIQIVGTWVISENDRLKYAVI